MCYYAQVVPHVMRSYRLDPKREQEGVFREWAGCARVLWNAALEQRTAAWQLARARTDERRWITQVRPSYISQARELTDLRREYVWLRAVPAQLLQQKLLDLDLAFSRFFAQSAGYPQPKTRKRCRDSFRFPQPGQLEWHRLSRHTGQLKVPKLGWVRFRWSQEVCDSRRGERVSNVTIIRKPDGWHVVFCVQVNLASSLQRVKDCAVGIDRGCVVAVATSDGELLDVRTLTHREQLRCKRLQRKLARQQSNSRRRMRTRRQLGRLSYRAACRRKEFVYVTARRIGREHSVVVLERLRVRAMTQSARGTVEKPGACVRQKSCLNRAILDK